jgi:adenine specific DNA methylase Mod
MDNLSLNEREIIKKLLTEYVDFLGNDDCVQTELIVDKEKDSYLLSRDRISFHSLFFYRDRLFGCIL